MRRSCLVVCAVAAMACSRPPAAREAAKPIPRAPGENWAVGQSPEPSPASVAINSSAALPPAGAPGAQQPGFAVHVYKRTETGAMAQVDPTQPFRSGDGVRFGVRASAPGHLYLLMKGSSGRSSLIYPDRRIGDGSNAISAGTEVVLPQDGWFVFDRRPGVETVYAMYSVATDPQLFSSIEAATGFSGGPANTALETQVLSALQKKSREFPAPAAAPGASGSATPASYGSGGQIVPAAPGQDGAVVLVLSLAHQ